MVSHPSLLDDGIKEMSALYPIFLVLLTYRKTLLPQASQVLGVSLLSTGSLIN
jgi:hypothetical protein